MAELKFYIISDLGLKTYKNPVYIYFIYMAFLDFLHYQISVS